MDQICVAIHLVDSLSDVMNDSMFSLAAMCIGSQTLMEMYLQERYMWEETQKSTWEGFQLHCNGILAPLIGKIVLCSIHFSMEVDLLSAGQEIIRFYASIERQMFRYEKNNKKINF